MRGRVLDWLSHRRGKLAVEACPPLQGATARPCCWGWPCRVDWVGLRLPCPWKNTATHATTARGRGTLPSRGGTSARRVLTTSPGREPVERRAGVCSPRRGRLNHSTTGVIRSAKPSIHNEGECHFRGSIGPVGSTLRFDPAGAHSSIASSPRARARGYSSQLMTDLANRIHPQLAAVPSSPRRT